ncbi:MAG: MazG family protein [Chlamydiia bacterium]|nr:MazG family protein [Chlamydiia bacterium]
MEAFDKLIEITNTLHGPKGCPWDKKQTFQSLRPHVLEEAHELLEAIDLDDTKGIIEELGDILFQIVFFAKIGEKTSRFTLEDVIILVSEKLVHRHPHVFGDVEAETIDDVFHHWEKAKAEEKKERKHPLEGIPKTLGALARAQKIVSKAMRKKLSLPDKEERACAEITIGDQFLDLIIQAEQEGVDAESAVRSALKKYEALFSS